ncbi:MULTISPECIES: hypothetical protein [Rhodomicrobium]|uniref:hypothetical protein n=1 Tax=Rhodomicrobium TaxID=1068 RepID=UPI001FD8C943|nr:MULTISPECIES: hypothetical protein [Rhodomicrobium]
MMKTVLICAGFAAIAVPASADEYYVVRGPNKECRVVESRPTDSTIMQVGPLAFKSRDEAERQRTVLCKDERGGGDKVIIKRD